MLQLSINVYIMKNYVSQIVNLGKRAYFEAFLHSYDTSILVSYKFIYNYTKYAHILHDWFVTQHAPTCYMFCTWPPVR